MRVILKQYPLCADASKATGIFCAHALFYLDSQATLSLLPFLIK